MNLVRLWATFLLVLSILLTVTGLVMVFVGEDTTMPLAGVLFFGGGALVAAVMRLDAGELPGASLFSVSMQLGRTPGRTAALVVASMMSIGAGVLMLRSEDPMTGWLVIGFGATCTFIFCARLIGEDADVEGRRSSRRVKALLLMLGCLGFVATSMVILATGGPAWIGWSGIVVFGLAAIRLFAILIGRGPPAA